jgi:AraC family transcriptional regulator
MVPTLWIEQHAGGVVCVEFGDNDQVSACRAIGSQVRNRIVEAMPVWDQRPLPDLEGAHHLHVRLPHALIARAAAAMGGRISDPFLRLLGCDEIVLKISRLLLEDAEEGGKRGPLYAESLAMALSAHLLATCGVKGTPQRRMSRLPPGLLRRVTDYLEAHLEEDLSVQHLASLVDLSASHFSALFTRATGVSPHRFVIQKRVERARELLALGTDPIAQVAMQVGFYDQSHLTRQMRRLLGVCPAGLRRVNQHRVVQEQPA